MLIGEEEDGTEEGDEGGRRRKVKGKEKDGEEKIWKYTYTRVEGMPIRRERERKKKHC